MRTANWRIALLAGTATALCTLAIAKARAADALPTPTPKLVTMEYIYRFTPVTRGDFYVGLHDKNGHLIRCLYLADAGVVEILASAYPALATVDASGTMADVCKDETPAK